MTIIEADHLGKLFRERVRASASRAALTHQAQGPRVELSWGEVGEQATSLAARLDVGPGERVALFSENRPEWIYTDLAIHLLGAVHVPIHSSLTGHQAAYQMLHAAARRVVVSSAAQAEKLAALTQSEWEAVARSAETSLADFQRQVTIASFDEVACEILGKRVKRIAPASDEDRAAAEEKIQHALADAKPSDLATILYTSGTTGEPKGVMLTHGNLTSNTIAAVTQLGERDTDVRLNYLPLSHVFARTCDLYTWIVAGSRLELAKSRETAIADLRTCKPTLLNTVPFFLERIYRYLADNNLLESPTAAREMMGGNLRLVNSGGAALPNYLYDYFNDHGVPLFQGYGLSETSPIISCCGPGRDRRGSAGRPIPGIEVKIAEDGEIVTRGPHVMPGYYRNEAATRDVIQDGWFHTGDLGRLDADDFLYITGRKKEIIVLSSGKNISPALIEGLLLRDSLIAQVAIFGDDHNCLAALVVPNFERLKAEMGETDEAKLLACEKCKARYREVLTERLTTLSPHEQVKTFALLAKPFSIDAGELTAKMSMRRSVIANHYRAVLHSLYGRDS